MDCMEMKMWLDSLINELALRKSLAVFNNRIRTYCPSDSILITNIHEVADIMGLELKEEKISVNDFHYEYFFEYRGIRFYDYQEERMERFAGTDRKSDGC